MFSHKKKSEERFSLALVTGASSGIGTALCHLLAAKQIPLIITGRDVERLNALAAELLPFVDVIVLAADLADAEGRGKIVKCMHEYHPNLVINNAGFGLYGEALTYETNAQLEIVQVNATAVLELTLEGARAMISAQQKGVVINVSSAAAKQVFPCLAVYSATKTFVNQITESLDLEMQKHGIRVLAACPGMVATGFSSRAAGQLLNPNEKGVMTASFAAEEIWWQIEKRKCIHIFDWKVRLATFFSYFLPKSFKARILIKSVESRHPPRKIILPPSHP
ncbi:MAG: SDR family NAD(P)-dependent oxidoreductase [Parachlamydiaceae bacterium]|nr:SDR family NAD(P)-dependent oxidoreductase [Parachlamydiaceae bacterium]